VCRCIEYGELALYVEGLLDAEQVRDVEKHIARCPECGRELARLRALGRLIQESRANHWAEAPAHLVDAALTMIPVAAEEVPLADIRRILDVGRDVKRILATLVTPAPRMSPAFARGDTEQRTQLLYQAEEYEITLSVRRMDQTDQWVIVGDVFGEDGPLEDAQQPPVEVLLTDRDSIERKATAMEGEEFVLDGVSPGRYSLLIHRGDKLLEIRDLRIF
jgi:hypothetical protein